MGRRWQQRHKQQQGAELKEQRKPEQPLQPLQLAERDRDGQLAPGAAEGRQFGSAPGECWRSVGGVDHQNGTSASLMGVLLQPC
jgi:hypothetical protein